MCTANSFLNLWLFRSLILWGLLWAIPRPPSAACLVLWYSLFLIGTFVLDQCLLNVIVSSVFPRSRSCLICIKIFVSRLARWWPEPPTSTFLLSRFWLFLLILLLMSVFGRFVIGNYPRWLLCWIIRWGWHSCRTGPKPPITRLLLISFNLFFHGLGILFCTRSCWYTGHDCCRSQCCLSRFICFVT